MSVLSVSVSCFRNYYTADNPQPVNLITWLRSGKYAQEVAEIRQAETKEERDKIKATLPAITPSGIFTQREAAALVEHSGLIQFDIDFADNSHIANFGELKAELCKLPEIAYCGLSVSGRGFWGLIPIAFPERHKEHFAALQKDFARFGISLDSKPGNVASLRGYSYDPEAYFNHAAKPYTRLEIEKAEQYSRRPQPPQMMGSEAEKVEAIIFQIEMNRMDITAGYAAWFEIAAALANEFGEGGRDYFHRISQYYPRYSVSEADRQFTACLRHRYRYSMGSLYQIALDYGIEYRAILAASPAQEAPRKATAPKSPPQPPGGPQGEVLPQGWARMPDGLLLDHLGLPATWGEPSTPQEAEAIRREEQRQREARRDRTAAPTPCPVAV